MLLLTSSVLIFISLVFARHIIYHTNCKSGNLVERRKVEKLGKWNTKFCHSKMLFTPKWKERLLRMRIYHNKMGCFNDPAWKVCGWVGGWVVADTNYLVHISSLLGLDKKYNLLCDVSLWGLKVSE